MNETDELKRAIRVVFGEYGEINPTKFLKEIAIEYPEVVNKVSRKLGFCTPEEHAIGHLAGIDKYSDIRIVREFTGMGLKEAKEFCEKHHTYD